MKGLHPADLTVLIVYFAGITILGVWTARRVRGLADFFMPRRFGKAMMIAHAFGTGTATDQAVSVASATAQRGLSGIWYQWLWLLATPFYWLLAPIFRRFRALTTADVLELRFDRSVAVLFAVVGIASMSVKIGVMLKGAGALIDAGTGGLLDADLAILVVTVLFVLYGCAGGLGAAIVTDFVQGILTLVFSFILLPVVLVRAGGLAGIRATLADTELLSLVAPARITTFFVIMMSVQALVGIVAQPHIMGVCAAGRSEWEGRVGIVAGNFIKRLCTVAWCVTAVAAVAWYVQNGTALSSLQESARADQLYGEMARVFLPAVAPGLLGVFLASLLAAVMSSCDSFMLSSAGLFTENIYRPLFPSTSERVAVWVGRAASVLVVAGGVTFAYRAENVVGALETWFKIAPMTGIVLWLGLFWTRLTVAGAWAATLTGFGAWFLTTTEVFVAWVGSLPAAGALGFIDREAPGAPEIHTPWQILFYLTAAVAAACIASALTRPVAPHKVALFHRLLRTPVRPGETVAAPCTLPEDALPPRPLLIDRCGIVVPRPSRTSVVGFLVSWLVVAALIAGFQALMVR